MTVHEHTINRHNINKTNRRRAIHRKKKTSTNIHTTSCSIYTYTHISSVLKSGKFLIHKIYIVLIDTNEAHTCTKYGPAAVARCFYKTNLHIISTICGKY